MSVYKPKKATHFQYDFWLSGARFCGSTGKTSKREAAAVERIKRDEARREIAAGKAAAAKALTLGVAANRYWNEVGQYHSANETTLTNIERLVKFFGKDKRLDQVTADDVSRLIAWRRQQTVKGRKFVHDARNPRDETKRRAAPRISPSTVNRTAVEPLQRIMTRARRDWKVPLPDEPKWKELKLPEPEERVREVREHEEGTLDELRADYQALIAFSRESGLRMTECLLRKREIDLAGGFIETLGKGKRKVRRPITIEMRRILMAEMANPTDHVFTYVARRDRRGPNGWKQGDRRPITQSGLKTLWRRARAAGVLPEDLRFHDMRHDFATKLLRETGNLKLVQKALGHARLETTAKYAHVLNEEIRQGMEAASRRRRESRKKSRSPQQGNLNL